MDGWRRGQRWDWLWATDELGYNAEQDIVHVRVFMRPCFICGINKTIAVKHQGLDTKLTGVEKARVVKDVLI